MSNDPLDPANDPTRGRTVLNGDDFDMSIAPVYEKTGKIRAMQMLDPFVVVTLEGIQHGEMGDYLAEAILSDGSAGERWPVRKSRFHATYRLAGPGLFALESAPCEPGEFGADPGVAVAMRDNPLSVHYKATVTPEDL